MPSSSRLRNSRRRHLPTLTSTGPATPRPYPLVSPRTPRRLPTGKDHLHVEVPEELIERLVEDETSAGAPLLRLTLDGTTAGFPFLTELYQRHGVKCRIVKVWFEYSEKGAQYGQMLTEVQDRSSLERTRSFLSRLGIGVEVLGYLQAS